MGKGPGQFGSWLRRELDRRGYTERGGITRFARESDVHLSSLSRILNEDRVPEIDALRKIGNALGVPLGEMLIHAGIATSDELRVREPEPTRPPAPSTSDDGLDYATMSTEELLRAIKDPTPTEQAMLKYLASMDVKIASLLDRLAPKNQDDASGGDENPQHRNSA